MLSGLTFEDRELVGFTWREFWRQYEVLNPDFGLFYKESFDPSTTIGLYIHGDEGRTLKRNALMVTSIQSVVGSGFNAKRLKRPREDQKLQVNFAGHTFMTRLVVSALPKQQYQSDPDVFHTTMDVFAQHLLDLLETGLADPITGVIYKFCVLGIKGDMPYLQKVARLKRSWNTTVKRGSARKEPPGVCHLCLAGTSRYPCEDTSSSPCWVPTIGVKVPWDVTPEFLRLLPHDRVHPGTYLKPDLWHCIHLGIGKAFVASTLQVALQVVPGSNNDSRFQWLTDHYENWCRTHKRNMFVSKISAYLVSYNDATGATGNWSKGSLTANLMKWLAAVLDDLPEVDDQGTLGKCKDATKALNFALSFLYNAALFLERDECRYVSARGMSFLQTYTALARQMYDLGNWHLYPLFPKIHAVHHVWHGLHSDAMSCGFSMNPLTASCQQDEDVIGRVSRVSRRVNIRVTMQRTLERHLMACYKVWKDANLLV